MATCEYYIELLSAGLDGQLTEEQERELAQHLVSCPACREIGVQLAAAHAAFAGMEELEAPEGFARGVMDRIRREEGNKPKVVPLFRRPQVKMLGSLAACAVLCVGLMNGTFAGKGGSAAPAETVNSSSTAAYYAKADHAAAEAPAAMAPAAMAPESAPAGGMKADAPAETEVRMERDGRYALLDCYDLELNWNEELTAPRAVVVAEPENLAELLSGSENQTATVESFLWEGTGSVLAVVLTEPCSGVSHAVVEVTEDTVTVGRWAPPSGDCVMTAHLILIRVEGELPVGEELKVVLVEN